MELSEVVRRRRMVRRYSPEPVDPAAVDRMLRNAVRAPSAGFSQGVTFLVLDTPADVALFWEVTVPPEQVRPMAGWLSGMTAAPVVVVPMSSEAAYRARYAEPDKAATGLAEGAWSIPYWHVDAGMATLLVLQTVVEEGLGACFFGIQSERLGELRRAFGIPADQTPVGAVTVGHRAPDERAAGSGASRARRPLEEVVHRGRWGQPWGQVRDQHGTVGA